MNSIKTAALLGLLSGILLVGGPESIDMQAIEDVREVILDEVNVRAIEYVTDSAGLVTRSAKANFKRLGARLGKQMKAAAAAIAALDSAAVGAFIKAGQVAIEVEGGTVTVELADVEILSEEQGGWLVAQEGLITVALDTVITDELRAQGYAREAVRCIQSLRKKADLALTDRITVELRASPVVAAALALHEAYLAEETLARSVRFVDTPAGEASETFEVGDAPFEVALARSAAA